MFLRSIWNALRKFYKICNFILLLGIMVYLLTSFTVRYGKWEAYHYKIIVHKEVSADIPEGFNNKKILFISDFHCDNEIELSRVKKLVVHINKIAPDLILLGGDYISRNPSWVKPFFEEMKSLKAPLGIYGVLGNHDHWTDAALVRNHMLESGITILDNKATWINSGSSTIKIGGVGDYWDSTQDLAPILLGTTEENYVILLSHQPDFVPEIKDKRIDLVLSGHTHGGQFGLFGLWYPFTGTVSKYGNTFRTGMVQTEFNRVLVSNGFGANYPHMRFGARAQLNLIIFESKSL